MFTFLKLKFYEKIIYCKNNIIHGVFDRNKFKCFSAKR